MSRDAAQPGTAGDLRTALRKHADAHRARILQRFFKTGPGEYAEGDVFLGVSVPVARAIARRWRGTPLSEAAALLESAVHEERLLALLLLVDAFRRGSVAEQRAIYRLYLSRTAFINNWDLVDVSAYRIVGPWLQDRSRAPLRRLARSTSVWERRIAIIATLHFIRRHEFDETFRIADLLLADGHDLIHKATGWMLREVGNRSLDAERAYLAGRYRRMPRTMLRYAIEKFPPRERLQYLRGRK